MVDFLDAYKRHWDDAEILFGEQRLPNADHLYGLSAECGLKRLMIYIGMPLTPNTGDVEGKYRLHANKIWQAYETYRSGRKAGPGFVLPTPNPFSDYDINQRYANRADFDSVRVSSHRNGAGAIRALIKNAQKQGLI